MNYERIKNVINWKLYFVLLAMSALSIVAIMPYIVTIQGEILRAIAMPLPLVILVSVLQSVVLFAVLIFLGLLLSKKMELNIPILEGFIDKKKSDINLKSLITKSVLAGVLSGVLIVLLNYVFSQLGLESLFKQTAVPPWQGFLASFYGGISEELVMRLFFMTFILWILTKITRFKGRVIENNLLMWSSIIIASLIFGLGHLPITSTLVTITPLVVFRALLLNGVGGLVFGWLFWKKGLESAMIAHFSADIIIHVLLPLFFIF